MACVSASIIICVYNGGRRVLSCLESLARLSGGDFEIVLVDDASTDETPRRLFEFQQSHAHLPIRIVRNERNLGVSGARNRGIQESRGDVVLFTDCDCTAEVGWLEAIRKGFVPKNVVAVGGRVLTPPPKTLADRAYHGTSGVRSSSRPHRVLQGGNMAFRREVVSQYGFDEAMRYYCDEDELSWRLRSDGHSIAYAPEAIVAHDHPQTLRSYLRQGYRQGQGAARLWYKQGVYVGRDLWFVIAALVAAPIALVDRRLLVVPVVFLGLQLIAIVYNESVLKAKSWKETACVLPMCVAYYVCKTWGVFATYWGIVTGGEPAIRASKRRWRERGITPRAADEP